MTLTSAAAAADAAWPIAGTAGSPPRRYLSVELSHGLRAVAALEVELTALAVSCAAPLTAHPAWQLAAAAASPELVPWVLLVRNEAGAAVGAVVLFDHLEGRRTLRTTLGGTDGGHRGAILTDDPAVARALGEAWRATRAAQHRPAPVTLGPLPADSPVVEAFDAGLSTSRQERTDAIPIIDRAAGVSPADYLTDGMRRTLRKAANRLTGDGRQTVPRFTSDCAEIRGMLPQLVQVYRQRDHVQGRTSELDDTVGHQTWRHRVLDLAETGALELATLHIDGELTAYALGITDGPVYRLLEGRFVTCWARYSPGRLLEAMVVERALADAAVTTFDWMTAVASESLLGRNDADPMVLVSLD